MKLKIHSKISPNNRWREGAKEKRGERAYEGEEKCTLDFKIIMSYSQ